MSKQDTSTLFMAIYCAKQQAPHDILDFADQGIADKLKSGETPKNALGTYRLWPQPPWHKGPCTLSRRPQINLCSGPESDHQIVDFGTKCSHALCINADIQVQKFIGIKYRLGLPVLGCKMPLQVYAKFSLDLPPRSPTFLPLQRQ
jgi:hypothetical protein